MLKKNHADIPSLAACMSPSSISLCLKDPGTATRSFSILVLLFEIASGILKQFYIALILWLYGLFVWDMTPYQQYYSYFTATVHKSMFPGLFLTDSEHDYRQWKEFRENIGRCTGLRNINRIGLKTALNTIQSRSIPCNDSSSGSPIWRSGLWE